MYNELIRGATSVYEGQQLENNPLQKTALELMLNYGPGCVFELGCNDAPLGKVFLEKEGLPYFGTDLAIHPLSITKQKEPNLNLYQSDVTEFPFNLTELLTYGKVGVMALELFEHLSESDATKLLEQLHKQLGDEHIVVASMPVFSFMNITTIGEAVRNIVRSKGTSVWADTGVLDKTHKILTDTNGHIKIFNQAGYNVNSPTSTKLWNYGMTGEWEWMGNKGEPRELYYRTYLHKLFAQAVYDIIPNIGHKLTGKEEEDIIVKIMGWQALYLLQP